MWRGLILTASFIAIHNSVAWSPRFKGWYDYNRRISWMVETYYAHNRPDITLRLRR